MNIVVNKERNSCIELYRGVICLLVVLNHMWPVQNFFYHCLWGVTGATMALFLMISGYFLYTPSEEKLLPRLAKRIRSIFLLSIQTLGFYYGIKLAVMLPRGQFSEFSEKYLAPGELLKLLFPNSTSICGPMWYLLSLLYSIILISVLVRLRFVDKVKWCIPCLLLVCLILSGEFGAAFPYANPEYARFFLIHGFPFVLSGFLIHQYQEKLLSTFDRLIQPWTILLLIAAGIVESCFAGCNVITVSSSMTAVLFLLFALKNPTFGNRSILTQIGTKDSLHVYLTHWCLTSVATRALQQFPSLPWVITYLAGIVIWLVCIALSRSYIALKHFISERKISHVHC